MPEKKYQFSAKILTDPKWKNSAYVEFPYDTLKEFGKKGQVKIKVIFDGKVNYRGSLAKMGHHCHILILRKDIRAALEKEVGHEVSIELWEDKEPRIVEVPEYISKRINEHQQRAQYFDQLSYTHQKEYINWVTGAKKEETRARRLEKMMTMLDEKVKHP